ncbi:hypothetical protein V6N12_039958 [Hibiscus sabdariffa]|uniref:protein-serine/threonine phosphatase n=1 Tax=Hibiscus sabdariffa TaxID=183260 RepID=A0ABR2E294_9ROSI
MSGGLEAVADTIVMNEESIPLWGSVSTIGKRKEMEDAISCIPRFTDIPIRMLGDHSSNGISQSNYFAIFDGHGGAQVSNYCQKHMHQLLSEEIASSTSDTSKECQLQWQKTFSNCNVKLDNQIRLIAPDSVGSTAVVALICASHIIVSNCGDSRAVLSRGKEVIALSKDDKVSPQVIDDSRAVCSLTFIDIFCIDLQPNREDELARIEAAGGKVLNWDGDRVFGILAVSRSIGDRYLKPWIIPEPDVVVIPRAREDEILILASDGFWDVISNEEACKVAWRRILMWYKKNGILMVDRGNVANPASQAAAKYLLKLAIKKRSEDNISIIVINFNRQAVPLPTPSGPEDKVSKTESAKRSPVTTPLNKECPNNLVRPTGMSYLSSDSLDHHPLQSC